MNNIHSLDILETKDKNDFVICANMMLKTNPWITLGLNFEQCHAAFEGIGKEVYILKKEEEILGFVILQIAGTFRGYIQTLCINENYRGQGLGKKLLTFCEERIRQISPNIFICVSSFNTGALKLYQAMGFTLVGELENFVRNGFTELLLRKSFGPMIKD